MREGLGTDKASQCMSRGIYAILCESTPNANDQSPLAPTLAHAYLLSFKLFNCINFATSIELVKLVLSSELPVVIGPFWAAAAASE